MINYEFKDNKGKFYIAELEDDETAELFAQKMGLTLIGKGDK